MALLNPRAEGVLFVDYDKSGFGLHMESGRLAP
jgi:hypothetical protein